MANNVITATYSSSNITYTKPAYQYDYGMILKFSGIELPQAYEVHFSNTEFCGNSITQIGGVDGVTIPDEMFLNGNPIYAWTYLHTGADDGETVYKAVISINKRAKPTNATPTPVQQDAITQAIAALNVAVEQTAADVVAAGESAEAAAGSAEAAGQAKDDAVEAKDKAVEAKNAAETAQGKAEDAQRAAEQAAGSVLGLTADASVDANIGTPSVEVDVSTVSNNKHMEFSFHNLKGTQGDPGQDGQDGQDGFSPTVSVSEITGGHEIEITDKNGTQSFDVMDGQDGEDGEPGEDGFSPVVSVTPITGGHSVSITDAEGTQTFEILDGVDGEVTEAALEERLVDKADVITSTASGEIVTIADGGKDMPVVDLSLSLLPVQDLHGQSSPYPAGGGKNMLNPKLYVGGEYNPTVGTTWTLTESAKQFVANADNSVFTLTTSATWEMYVLLVPVVAGGVYKLTGSISSTGTLGTSLGYLTTNYEVMQKTNSTIASQTWSYSPAPTAENVGYYYICITNRTTASVTITLTKPQFEQSASATAYAPYSNLCPISGWTGVNVYQTSENVFASAVIEQGTIAANGNSSASDYRVRFANRVTVKPGTYKLITQPVLYGTIRVYNVGGAYIEGESVTAWTKFDGYEFTLTAERDIRLSLTFDASNNVRIVPSDVDGVSASKVARSYPISWQSEAGTVYGGTLDVTSGVLRVDWVKYRFTKEDNYAGWSFNSSGQGSTAYWIAIQKTVPTSAHPNTPNDGDAYGRFSWGDWRYASIAGKCRAYIINGTTIRFVFADVNTDIRTLANLKSWVEGICGDDYSKYPEAVYELATPTTYQLTPTQISTLLGTNNFWGNGNGQIDLEYRADTKLYIEQLTKPSEDDMTANANIASGVFFMVGNNLYLSTASIASGEAIVPGTNCTALSLADALNNLNA